MYNIGIDIGSTASKTIVLNEEKDTILEKILLPTGWNSKETSMNILEKLENLGYKKDECNIVATGYGRVSVPYADKTVTEITCHAKGTTFLFGDDVTVIDIGGQDTKIILIKDSQVSDFIMNDKCSAGTGKFLEVMANRLGFSLQEILDFSKKGKNIQISSMCTVFAESEIISLIGKGTPREDIANGVVNSICSKVVTLANKKEKSDNYFLTGGFCDSDYIVEVLSKKLSSKVHTHKDARFAGAIGAGLLC